MAVTRKQRGIEAYGCLWPTDDPIRVEYDAIRYGGKWKGTNGQDHGMGLPYHIVRFAQQVWPWFKWHRWATDLMLPELCRTRSRVAIFGPSSSSKSCLCGLTALTLYYAHPDNTTVIVTSTTKDDLEGRIWGEIKSFHGEALQRCDWLPGHLIESKQIISTDGKGEEGGRDMRNGIMAVPVRKGGTWVGLGSLVGRKNDHMISVADECFPAGTLVDTPNGPKPIETIHIRDTVINACGVGIVVAASLKFVDSLVRVRLRDGRSFSCTKNHKLLTQFGWIAAELLGPENYLVSPNESLQILREGNSRQEPLIRKADFLRSLLFREMDAQPTGNHGETEREDFQSVLRASQKTPGMGQRSVRENQTLESDVGRPVQEQNDRPSETNGSQAENSRREWNWSYCCGENSSGKVSGCNQQLSSPDGNESGKWIPHPLQDRRSVPETADCCGIRRQIAFSQGENSPRCQEAGFFGGAWVDSVEVFQPENPNGNGIRGGGIDVYNIEVSGHPSYSVNGFVVHNCHLMNEGFLESLANLESNPIFRSWQLGNLNELSSQLGQAAEPELGWDSVQDSEKSRVYPTRWCNGTAIQLIGKDSPNLDYPEGAEPYPKLIGRDYLNRCARNYGKDTPLYNMFAAGKIPRGTMENRVITKQVCQKFHAFDEIIWGHEPLTKLYAADISYTAEHGDRTVGRPFAFGRDNEGRLRLAPIEKPLVYTPNDRATGSIEEQIAGQMMAECKRFGIEPDHVFYDGTGRSSFTAAIMRLWSTQVVPLEFGGSATNRPNFVGRRYHEDMDYKRKKGDLLPCDEVFGKFVSELWFAFRALVEADQVRNMDEETVKEGCLRLWKLTMGNRMDVEPKKEMKLRIGRSPDLFDCVVVGLEGARRLGFPLGQLESPTKRNSMWLSNLNRDFNEAISSSELVAA